jgi:hypothetical protein
MKNCESVKDGPLHEIWCVPDQNGQHEIVNDEEDRRGHDEPRFRCQQGLEFVVGDDVQSLVEFSRWLGRPVC